MRGLIARASSIFLKALEPFYGFQERCLSKMRAPALRQVHTRLNSATLRKLNQTLCNTIAEYNAVIAINPGVADWLEPKGGNSNRAIPIPRPATQMEHPRRLDGGSNAPLPLAQPFERACPLIQPRTQYRAAARWLLSHLLDWHRREAKSEYWEYYRLGPCAMRNSSMNARVLLVFRLLTTRVSSKIPTDRYFV